MSKIKGYFNNFFWLFLTYLLAPFFYFFIFLRKKKNNTDKILIVSPAKIGDLVCITPVFREIKKKFPSCQMTVITVSDSQGLLKNNPHIDEIISITDYSTITKKLKLIKKLRKSRYDWCVITSPVNVFINIIGFWSLIPKRSITFYKALGEMHYLTVIFNNYCLEYKKHTLALRHFLNLLKFMGIKEYSEKREIFITPKEEKKAEVFLQKHNLNENDLLVGVSVTAGIKLLEWMPDRWAKLSDRLIDELQAKIIFTGALGDENAIKNIQNMMKNKSVNSAGFFALDEVPALMKKMKLFVSVESGGIFIADAMETPAVVIVGLSDINMKEQPLSGKRHQMIQKNLPCRPCSFVFLGERVCKEGHVKCLKDVTVEEVLEAAHNVLYNS